MKRTITALATAATLAVAAPASAATLDFTANNDTSGTVVGTTWTVTSGNGNLRNATHKTNEGCDAITDWTFACSGGGTSFDVGFGVDGAGPNDNEIDKGQGFRNEYVQVEFGGLVKVKGFAGMLTYDEELPLNDGDRERVKLEYSSDGGASWNSVKADPLFTVDDGSGSGQFNTVGLAYRDGLDITADFLRFRAAGPGAGDDGTLNITAAGLKLAAVPLPAGAWMLLAGVGGLAAMRRRKKA